MLERLLKDMRAFANASDADTSPDSVLYQYIVQVAQHDMRDGLRAASQDLVDWSMAKASGGGWALVSLRTSVQMGTRSRRTVFSRLGLG